MRENGLVIAIDGVVASGKGTLARLLAEKLGYIHIDTGAMYRAVTFHLLEKEININDEVTVCSEIEKIDVSFEVNKETKVNEVFLNEESIESKIRNERISKNVPHVAHIPCVRVFARDHQRSYGEKGGIVLDGRDIGTVVFPGADLKIFLTADAEVRAKRRFDELVGKGQEASFEDILKDLNKRDEYDMSAKISPLKQAEDAILVDSTNMTIPEVVDYVYDLAQQKLKS
jgi:cytidylate kinase